MYVSFQNEARKLNHVEVVEEDKRKKLPSNWEARKRKIEWEVAEEEAMKVSTCIVIATSEAYPIVVC